MESRTRQMLGLPQQDDAIAPIEAICHCYSHVGSQGRL